MAVPETQPKQTSAADRRRPRRAVNMRGYLIRDGGISHVINVTDLNYGGCGIQVPVELDVGESVKMSVLTRGSIAAQVRWYHDGKAGLVFEPIPEDLKKQVERRAGRVEVPGEIALKAMGRSNYRVRILDLSTDGCRVELVERPNVGDTMLVKFDGIETMEAKAAWVEGHIAGLRFHNKIHPAVLELLLQRLGAN
jgi:hypothetical protein